MPASRTVRTARRLHRTANGAVRAAFGAAFLIGLAGACSSALTGGDEATSTPGVGPTSEAGPDVVTALDAGDSAKPDVVTPDSAGIDGGMPGVVPAVVDFGLVNCGTTTAAKTFTIVNPSANIVAWTASLGKGTSAAFTLSPISGSLAPGASAVVTVTPTAVPTSSSTSPNGLGDVVSVALDSTTTSVQLLETAQGAQLSFVPSNLDFGNQPLAAGSSSSNIGVANSGNLPANVTLTLTGTPEFSLPGNSATAMLTAAPATVPTTKVTFAPTGQQSYAGSIAIATTGVLCGQLPPALALAGTGTNGAVGVTPASILFGVNGFVDCGTQAAAQSVTIKNTGSGSLTWTGALLHGASFFTLSAASGTIAASGSQIITVTPKAIPGTASVASDAFGDTLTISTNVVGDSPHSVALHATAHGATITRSVGSLGFGNVPIGTTSTQQYTYANTGNVDAPLSFANGDPGFTQAPTVTVGAGGFASPLVSFAPTMNRPYTDIGTVAVVGAVPLCGTLPGSLTLSGTGTTPSITATPSSLNFGFVLCGGKGNPLTVKITNNGAATSYSAILLKGAGSYFTVSPASGMIPATGFVTLTVTPASLPTFAPTSSNFFGDTLEVSTSNGTVDIALSETALGAVLVYNKASIAYGAFTVGTTSTNQVNVSNTGNLAANVTLATSPSVYAVNPPSASLTASTSLPFNVSFTPAAITSYNNGALTMSVSGTTLCSPLPLDVVLTGSGK